MKQENFKILDHMDCNETYGKQIIQYVYDEEVGFFFTKYGPGISDLEPFLVNEKALYKEYMELISMNHEKKPHYLEIAAPLLKLILSSEFETISIEKSEMFKLETGINEFAWLKDSIDFKTGKVFATAMCAINWAGHPVWGKVIYGF